MRVCHCQKNLHDLLSGIFSVSVTDDNPKSQWPHFCPHFCVIHLLHKRAERGFGKQYIMEKCSWSYYVSTTSPVQMDVHRFFVLCWFGLQVFADTGITCVCPSALFEWFHTAAQDHVNTHVPSEYTLQKSVFVGD
ncbi:hypothetical protein EXN66_Car013933 [Channa argus]|uniref:Uncharacterized protein n=1 Tax=Channa argus TaxID=215402 RepID=A0A6G1Q6V9_CHAAH|nr:hypothetical protein EXN66_Car013933 [Channa argus]